MFSSFAKAVRVDTCGIASCERSCKRLTTILLSNHEKLGSFFGGEHEWRAHFLFCLLNLWSLSLWPSSPMRIHVIPSTNILQCRLPWHLLVTVIVYTHTHMHHIPSSAHFHPLEKFILFGKKQEFWYSSQQRLWDMRRDLYLVKSSHVMVSQALRMEGTGINLLSDGRSQSKFEHDWDTHHTKFAFHVLASQFTPIHQWHSIILCFVKIGSPWAWARWSISS